MKQIRQREWRAHRVIQCRVGNQQGLPNHLQSSLGAAEVKRPSPSLGTEEAGRRIRSAASRSGKRAFQARAMFYRNTAHATCADIRGRIEKANSFLTGKRPSAKSGIFTAYLSCFTVPCPCDLPCIPISRCER